MSDVVVIVELMMIVIEDTVELIDVAVTVVGNTVVVVIVTVSVSVSVVVTG